MNRKDITKTLTNILICDRLSDRKYYAKEVTLDYGTDHTKRIDVMQFRPKGVIHASDIEKGIFVCYEIKSCKEDLYSGHGLNFYGEKNYIVITMDTYKEILPDLNSGEFIRYLITNYPESSYYYGILVAIPKHIDIHNSKALHEEFENPTEFNNDYHNWKFWTAMSCREGPRNRSTTELLFCMLRSKHSASNN